MSVLRVLAGIIAFNQLSIREYPDTDPPIVSVQTTYRGAAANVVESRSTQVLEDRLSGIEGIQNIPSQSQDCQSGISIEFNPAQKTVVGDNDGRERVGGEWERGREGRRW